MHKQKLSEYLIIFDCDGVLVDSEKLSQEVWINSLKNYGVELNQREFQRQYIGLDGVRVKVSLESEFNISLPVNFLDEIVKKKKEIYKKRLNSIKGVSECLQLLRNYKLCVASANSLDTIKNVLTLVKLEHFFGDNLFSAKMVKKGKPAPDLFIYASDKLAIRPSNCIVIEDTVNGINAGKSAGMNVLGFIGGSHCDADYIAELQTIATTKLFFEMIELPDKIAQILSGKDLDGFNLYKPENEEK